MNKNKIFFMIIIFFCPVIIGSTDLFKQGNKVKKIII